MLSASSSFIATNCPDVIFVASLAVIGGRAEERTTAEPGLTTPAFGLLPMSPDREVTSPGNVAKDCMALMTCPAGVLSRLDMTVTPDRADAGGSVPKVAVTIETESRLTAAVTGVQ